MTTYWSATPSNFRRKRLRVFPRADEVAAPSNKIHPGRPA